MLYYDYLYFFSNDLVVGLKVVECSITNLIQIDNYLHANAINDAYFLSNTA